MPTATIVLLGAVAGFTIFLGLPVGRLRDPAPHLRALLNAIAVGILLFLLWDVLTYAWEPLDAALGNHHDASAAGNGLVLAAGVGVGLLGLAYFDRWVTRDDAPPATDTDDRGVPAPEPVTGRANPTRRHGTAGQLALLIAVGIGLHNFAEGLAIGSAAASGEIGFATLLIIGFGLHNATEGFGIVAPLVAAGIRPSWSHLGMLGLIGGGPTLLGTLIGQTFTNDTVSIAFLALAAGSILYVIIELLAIGRRMATRQITTWGLFLGLLAGFATDAIVTAAGA